jgi:signal transduction histidine kinase
MTLIPFDPMVQISARAILNHTLASQPHRPPSPLAWMNDRPFALDSNLNALSRHTAQVGADQLVIDVARVFEQNPLLPGVILLESGQLFGMISRRRFLERMSRPYALELFLKRPVRSLHHFTQGELEIFPETTPIVEAARRSLERSPEFLYEPILVQTADDCTYYLVDVHQLLLAQSRIHQLTSQLLDETSYAERMQTEKMVSLGRMVAGVAHEIKNPVNSVNGNIQFLADYYDHLIELIQTLEEKVPASHHEELAELKDEIEYDFIIEDAPKIIKSVQLSSERLIQIVTSLRNFSRIDDQKQQLINIHDCLEGTLIILENQLKHDISVIRDYEHLPEIACYSGQMSQVFMNLLANAIDTVMERKAQGNDPHWTPQIRIETRYLEQYQAGQGVSIKIIDNGLGIPPKNQQKIFDNFFTTKPVGQGTGLGLAISYQIVVEKHHGELKLLSQVGQGTEFEVVLPF